MPEIPNYCLSENGLSLCTAGDDWRDCHFAEKNTKLDRCRFLVKIDDDLLHCSCVEAQVEARGVG